MLGVWLLSLFYRDASLVDRFWGIGFILLSVLYFIQDPSRTARNALVLGLVLLWGTRLFLYLHLRNRKKGEDARYASMRKKRPKSFWWWSLIFIFLFQALLMVIIAAPVLIVHIYPQARTLTWMDGLGLGIFLFGFLFEAVGDYQLAQFKKDPNHRGKVCDRGLWGRTRHPNYFGEAVLWWGFFVISLNVTYGWFTVVSPLLITFLLLKVSGVSLLEKDLKETKPAYAEYVRRVPSFFPKLF